MIEGECFQSMASSMSHAMQYWQEAGGTFTGAAVEMQRPSVLWRPRLFRDGDQWCALYGQNIQDGVAAFGKTPDEAMRNFDTTWGKP
jgi:hypothetical protein